MHAALQAPPSAAAALPPLAVPWPALIGERSYLVQYARRRLLDPALAEDLVHDVFEAVASGRALFAGRSALRSWLVGILKHKIVDLVRQRTGHDSLDGGNDADDGGADEDHAARELTCPQPRPDEVAEQRQRLSRTLGRIAGLPDTLREAVELRLLQDRDSSEVCRALSISEQNLFVRLHRARKALAH
jgi:RNA polymerase sigma-70 factor, ECF subfamily